MVFINTSHDGVSGISFPRLGQVILHGTKKARLINTSIYDIHWNLHICSVSVTEHLSDPLFLYRHLFPLIEWKQT